VSLAVLIIWLLIAGCATKPPYKPYEPPPKPPPPIGSLLAPEPPIERPATADLPSLQIAEILQLMASDPLPDVSPADSKRAMAQANARSIVRASRTNFFRSVAIFPYEEGAIYEIRTRDRLPTTLMFSHPEVIETVNKGDEFWDVERIDLGDPPNSHTYIVVTPKAPGLQTRMIVLGRKGRYQLAVTSYAAPEPEMVAVRWKLPDDGPKRPKLLEAGIYYTGYDIEVKAGAPTWVPLEVWDTGLGGKTLIRFGPDITVQEMPSLYLIANNGQRNLLNLHPSMPWLVIPRLVNRLELRQGHEDGAAVLISKGAKYRAVRCPQSDECPKGVL
jgi:type IV secretory pathway VirB9-like protein